MYQEEDKINCPTLKKQESAIKQIVCTMNQTKEVLEKARCAEQSQKEIEVVLFCSDYDESLYCKNCHLIANLRKKTTNLFIKAKKRHNWNTEEEV